MYDMYPWDNPADSASAETRNSRPRSVAETRNSGPRSVLPGPRHGPADESVAAIRAVQVALDRRDNGGDAVAGASQPGASQPGASQPGASQPAASRTRQ